MTPRASLRAAVALVNSAEEPDTLTNLERLDAWYAEHGFTGRHDSDEAELESVRALRPVLRELLTADRDRAAELVNELLAEAQAVPQLRRHDGLDWHIHAVPYDAPLARRIAVEVAMAMIDVIRADELSRLAMCVDDAASASCSISHATARGATAAPRARTETPSPPIARAAGNPRCGDRRGCAEAGDQDERRYARSAQGRAWSGFAA